MRNKEKFNNICYTNREKNVILAIKNASIAQLVEHLTCIKSDMI